MADLIQTIFKIIKKYNLIKAGEIVMVGFSGGPDSTCLLHILRQISNFFPISVIAAHFNHELRGEESNDDEAFVIDFCKQLDIPVYVTKFSNCKFALEQNNLSLEEKYRFIRYKWFEKLAEELNVYKIAVGHTGDDQLETVIMRFIKGSVSGLSGMKIKRYLSTLKLRLIRPLLYTGRTEILKYCDEFGLKPRLDSTNLCMDFDRNRIRHNILPVIKKENPKIIDTINKSISVISEEDDYLNRVCFDIFGSICVNKQDEIIINKKEFLKLHLAIQRRIIRMTWKKVSLSEYTLNFQHVEDIIRIIHTKEGSKTFSLPYNVYFFKEGDNLLFTKNPRLTVMPFCYAFKFDDSLYIKELDIKVKVENYQAKWKPCPSLDNEVYFDKDLLPSSLCWRNYQKDDYITPYGLDKKIKLSKLFTNNKIPHYKRNNYLLLAEGNKILWVSGLRRDNTAIITPDTKNIIKIM